MGRAGFNMSYPSPAEFWANKMVNMPLSCFNITVLQRKVKSGLIMMLKYQIII